MDEVEVPQFDDSNLIFFNFTDANIALLQCYGKYPEEDLKSMTKHQMDTLCQKEKNAIKKILESNEMTMSRVVSDRIYVLDKVKHIPLRITTTNGKPDPGVWKFKTQ